MKQRTVCIQLKQLWLLLLEGNMLKKLKKLFKNKEMINDTVNLILGLLMLTALLVFEITGNTISMYFVIFSGGLMTLSNGYRLLKQKNKRQMGQSMILFGIVILFLGMIVVLL